MASGKQSYARKRGYSKVHVLTWTIYLERDGFVPCSFQNCKFMAFNVVEMKNHFNTCKGEGFQAAYECKYCKGKTEHADKLEEHIVRYHGHEAEPRIIDTNMDARRSQEPDEDLSPAINAKSEISKVVICSWNVSKEMYGYIKCRDCSFLSDCVEEMKSHLLTCQKNPSAFAYECQKCSGRVASQATLDYHMAECHKDSILEDDNFIENYSKVWKEQIDCCGFARCGKKCKFVHIDCSRMKKHFKASCSMEAACQAVTYCDIQSCSIWSTSRAALLRHQELDHDVKTSNLKEIIVKKDEDEQHNENRREENLTYRVSEKSFESGIAESVSSEKCNTTINSEVRDESIKIEEKQTECSELPIAGRFSLETKDLRPTPHSLENIHGWEVTKLPMVLEPENNQNQKIEPENNRGQYSKEVYEKRSENDDLYQLQSPTVRNEITIDDPLSGESEDRIFFPKQSDYSRLEDSAFNKMEESVVSDDDDDSTSGMKAIIDRTRRCNSKMSEIFQTNSKETDKSDSLSTENDIKTKLRDSSMSAKNETNRLYGKKYGRKSNFNKDTRIHEETASTDVTSHLLPGTIKTEDCINKEVLDYKVNSKKQRFYGLSRNNDVRQVEKRKESLSNEDELSKTIVTEDTISGGYNNLSVSVLSPENEKLFNICLPRNDSSVNENRRGRSKNISLKLEDLAENQTVSPEKQVRSGRLGKLSCGLDPDLEEEVLTISKHGRKVLAENESSKTMTSDMNYTDSTSLAQDDHIETLSEFQKHKETHNVISLEKIGSSSMSQDESSIFQKKRGRPRKMSTGSNLSKNSDVEYLSTHHSQRKIERSEKNSSGMESQIPNVEENVQGVEKLNSVTLITEQKRGRPRKISGNMEGTLDTIQQEVQGGTERYKERTGQLGDHSQTVELPCLEPAKLQGEETTETRCGTKNHEDMKLAIKQNNTSSTETSQKKRERTRKISNNMGENLEGGASTLDISVGYERENSEEIPRELENHSKEVDLECPECERIPEVSVDEKYSKMNESIPYSHEDSLNNSLSIVKKRDSLKKSISFSLEDSTKVLSSQKKRGRPRKDSLDSVRKLRSEQVEDVVPTSPVQEEIESFKNVIGEVGENLEESESTKFEGVGRGVEEVGISDETKEHRTIELKTSSSHQDFSSVPSSSKKCGRPRKNSYDSVRNVEKVGTTPVQDEKESFKDDVSEAGKELEETEPTKPEDVVGNVEESIGMSSKPEEHSTELKTTSSSHKDSLNNAQTIVKKRGRPRKIISSSHEDLSNVPLSSKKYLERNIERPRASVRPRKNTYESVRNLEEVVPSTLVLEESECLKDDTGEVGKYLAEPEPIKPQDVEVNEGEPVGMSYELKDIAMELETIPSSLDSSQNSAQKIVKKRGRPKKNSSSTREDSANIPSSQKKRGRPRKNSYDSVRNLEKVVPSSPVLEGGGDSKNDIGEEGEVTREPEPIKPEEIKGMNSETKDLAKELKATPSLDNSHNSSQIIRKKRGRPKKISSSSHVGSTSVLSIQRKCGGPRKNSLNSTSNLENNVPTFPVQGEKERVEDVIGEGGENLDESELNCPNHADIIEEREKLTRISFDNYSDEIKSISSPKEDSPSKVEVKPGKSKTIGCSVGKHSEEEVSTLFKQTEIDEKISNDLEIEDAISPAHEEEDIEPDTIKEEGLTIPSSSSNIQKKRGRPKKRKRGQEDNSQIGKPKLSRGSTLKNSNIEESEKYVENSIDEHPNNDCYGKSTINIDSNKSSISSTAPEQKMKKKPGRPRKSESALFVNIDSNKSSISSTAPEQKMKKKPGRPRKSESALTQTSKEIEPVDNRDTNKPSKRNITKPKKFAQFFTEDSYFAENEQGNDKLVPEVQSISLVSDWCDASSASSIPNSNTKKKRGRPKKTSTITNGLASVNDPKIRSEKNELSKRKRTTSKPLKLSSYITDNSDFENSLDDNREVAGSSTIPADHSEDCLKSSSVHQAHKKRPGRPKKSRITDLDVSVDAEYFNKSLETKQNLCSTPRTLRRTVSKPNKYKDYVEEHSVELSLTSPASNDSSYDIQDMNEGCTDQKEVENLSRKHKRSHLSSVDCSNPRIEAKIRKVSNKSKTNETKSTTNAENVEVEPLDKNENYSPVESVKPGKIVVKKQNMPPGRKHKMVTCAICKKSFARYQYEIHASEHNYFCWVEGDRTYDFEKEDDIHNIFFQSRRFKSFKGFKCEKCGVTKKSSVGYLSHKSMCGISEMEKEKLKVPCPVCKRYMMPSSLKVHMGTEHRPTTKVSMEEEVKEVIPSGTKRAAAVKAESIFENELMNASESEESEPESLRKWFTHKKKENTPYSTLIPEELHLDKNNELLCPQPNCSFKTDDLDSLQVHHSECSKPNRDYECKICGTRVKELHEIKEHILTNHAQVIENDCSDLEFVEESKEEDFKEQQTSQQSSIYGKPNFMKQEYSRTGLNFIYRNLQRNYDRLQANHVQGCTLYKDLLAVPNGFLNEEDLLNYLPITQESMKISLGEKNWDQLKFMEGRATKDSSYVFVGGPVWAMDWCPTSAGNAHQYLAVSCHRDMDAVHKMGEVFSYNNVIQIWDFGAINLCSSSMDPPLLSIGVAHSQGAAWDVRWCPDGCHQPDSGRLGLLAAAFSSGAAFIYSVPLVTPDRGKPFYKMTPVVELTPPYDEPVQCCRIAWSCDYPYNIVAVGYEDGSVSLYDITTSSLLLKEGIKIHPYKVFTAHVECITGLQFIGNKTGKNLMTCSMDKALTFWNLLDTSAPITCNRKVPIRDAVWMNNWLCAVSVYDDCFTNGSSYINLNNFRDLFYLQTIPWLAMNNTHWSITVSEWSNSIAVSSETGEVYAMYPSQMFCVDHKATKKSSMHITTTVLKKLNSEGNQDENDEKLETAGPSNYKDAAENYGLVFTESRLATETPVGKENITKNLFPITSINKISFNPNIQAFTYLALGHHCGILRVVRDPHFDFAKEEIFNFTNSLSLR